MKACQNSNKLFKVIALLFLPVFSFAQNITFSDPVKGDTRNMQFEIMGKMKGNILVFKNVKSHYAIDSYDGQMQLRENEPLSFLPPETFNVDFIPLSDSFCLVYQYKKKGVVHCMAAKLDANVKLLTDPVELDATKIEWMSDNKIYTTVYSDDKKKILLFKIQKKNDLYFFETFLFDNKLKPIHQSQFVLPFNDKVDVLSDFFVDNDGNFVFAKATKGNANDDVNKVDLVIKPELLDTVQLRNINLNNNYIDEVKLKVDNVNKHYLINSLYFDKRHGSVAGIFCNVWDRNGDSNLINTLIPFSDSLRNAAKTDVTAPYAFDDYFIRNVIVKKDGGYLLTAEDYYIKTRDNNPWDRYNYGSPFGLSPYYNYYPSYNWYYRSYDPYNNQQSIRYFYNNILVLTVDKDGKAEWASVLPKQQQADDDDNYLSFLNFNVNGEIHFLFNETTRRSMIVNDNTFSADGTFNRNPPLKTMDDHYQFMPKFGKQVGARQVVIPCIYRNSICFAKIDY